jgi:hypothetical protein
MQGYARNRVSHNHRLHHDGTLRPTFARASQNMAAAAVLLDTLPVPSTDEVDKVYRQLKGILDIAVEQ